MNELRKTHLLDLNTRQLADWLREGGYPAFRAKQIFRWIFQGRAETFAEMSDLPAKLRGELEEAFAIWSASIARSQQASDGSEKLLVELEDRGRVECVLLRDRKRRSICISTQVGCAMGCVFCASGLDGVDRNLTTGEIVEQMLRLQRLLPADERLSHIVVMGMGEPLANIDRLILALGSASDKEGLGISPRRITISTVGLPPAMAKLTSLQSRYHLAVSLHAPNDELRDQLVPVNDKIGIEAILREADRYFEASGRRLTFEYVLLAGINDQEQHAHQLARLLRGRPAMLNVIPYNPVAGLPYATPSAKAIREFREVLVSSGVNVQFRQRKGTKLTPRAASCGGLRHLVVQTRYKSAND